MLGLGMEGMFVMYMDLVSPSRILFSNTKYELYIQHIHHIQLSLFTELRLVLIQLKDVYLNATKSGYDYL